jgi:hypothetical protein
MLYKAQEHFHYRLTCTISQPLVPARIKIMASGRRWAAKPRQPLPELRISQQSPQQPDLARHAGLFGAPGSRSNAIHGILAALIGFAVLKARGQDL